MSRAYNTAISKLQQVQSVEEWNEIRNEYKRLLEPKELIFIDSSGLIVEILGPDKFHYSGTNE